MTKTPDGWLLLNRPANESFIRFNLDTLALATKPILNPEQILECFPNPAKDQITVTFSLKDSATVRLSLCNVMGQSVKELLNGKAAEGTHQLNFDVSKLAKDNYLLILDSGADRITKKIVLK